MGEARLRADPRVTQALDSCHHRDNARTTAKLSDPARAVVTTDDDPGDDPG
jgi:hypothetical protein